MTSPQSDPATDVAAAIARLAEQFVGIHRRVDNLERFILARVDDEARLTDAKFVTYQALIDSQAEKVALALAAAKEAIEKADVATEKRFDAIEVRFALVNEFRGQLADQARLFMPRTEAQQLADQATQRIRDLAEQVPQYATRKEVEAMTERLNEAIGELKAWRNRSEGQGQGAKDNKAGLYATMAAIATFLGILVVVANFLAR